MNPILKAQIEKDIKELARHKKKVLFTSEKDRLQGKIEGLKLALDRFKVAHEVLSPTEYQNTVTGVMAVKMGMGWALRSIFGRAFFWDFRAQEWVILSETVKNQDLYTDEETALLALDTVQPYRP